MKRIAKINELQEVIGKMRNDNKTIGFVPTMGALHEGHLSLIEIARQHADVIVVSIFVNPTQFNDTEDFNKYPKNYDNDITKLQNTSTNIVFIPEVSEIYPEKDERTFDLGNLTTVMEGEFRPGHFSGVAQVVSRLFDIVQPQIAVFGEKDFQQLTVIKEMVKKYNYPIEIIGASIVRESNGLAMSSRNERLSPIQRKNASLINKVLTNSVEISTSLSVKETENWVINEINKNEHLKVEYYQIVDNGSLQPVTAWQENCDKTGCIAVFCGDVRLIDNVNYSL